ncbi:MAG: ABC transporter permease [Clostridiales bacterium]|nr:ABC transporter permease [Clostridiales bacterium]
MSMFYFFVQQTLMCMIPLLIVANGGIFSEKSGILNFSLEGIMLAGGFAGTLYLHYVSAGTQGDYIVGLLVAGVAGMIIILPHAVSSISLKGNQIISGMAINLLAPAATVILGRAILGKLQISFTNFYLIKQVPVLSNIPVIGGMFFQMAYISTLVGVIVLLIAVIVFNKTKFGAHLKACGENPQAAASMGINVTRTRYIGVLISGFIGGIGGLAFIVPNASEFASTVAGYGYLAVAVIIFGQWNPMRILWASLFFGFMKTLANTYTTMPALLDLGISTYVFKMIPYLATIIVLVFVTKKTGQPKALGVVYEQDLK